jgi:uncharacterized membrane protein HdeD (DUF308 family)
MKDVREIHAKLNAMRADITASAILCIAIGVTVILWPMQTIILLCRVLALLFLIMGISILLPYFADRKIKYLGLASGVVLILLGVFIMVRPTDIVRILPIVIGIVILLHGIKDMLLVMEGKEYEEERWWWPSLLATITLMFGMYLIWNYFQTSVFFIWFLGVALIYDGLSDLIILVKVKTAQRAAHQKAEAIDVEDVKKEE